MNKKIRFASLCVALIISVMCCFMLSACNSNQIAHNPDTDSSTPETTVAEVTETETTVSSEQTTEAETELQLLSEYKPYTAYDENGSQTTIDVVYGTSYNQYGGSLCFNDDGTFTTYIGVYADADKESGTYRIISATEIELAFNSGDVQIATINEIDDTTVTELEFTHRGYLVVFR